MMQTIYKDKLFYLYPSDKTNVVEFIYILNGTMESEINNQKEQLGPNDSFSAKGLGGPIYFVAKTDVTFLWIITEPTFHYISEDIKLLRKMVNDVESRDMYTFMHSERVADYSVRIAKKLNLNTEDLQSLFFAAELHDIGKINIPIEILNKPGKLTKEEFDVIKKHPGDGADMVMKTSYKHLAKIIEQHHERLNGSGYPHGLKGDDILLQAKIIAVSDTFDAMTEDRAYRKAHTAQYAMDEIKSMAGTHYEPEIVDALEKVLIEEGKIESKREE
ncbi:HD domain-containing phosphohydrolase [Peribacillus sp. B-H-3]|uniref:HD domain-containing phosphohydrolase n=1 Tax=Peribacillus sp. B-H-3 TaxID=3400420 RepID=UPI003B026976